MYDRYELKELLQNGVITVVFEKVDGTLREMNCTLDPSYFPQLLREEGDISKRTTPDTILSVWDVDSGGWRSFRIDSVKEVRVL